MVFAKNHGQGDPWLRETVTKWTGPVLYQVHLDRDGPICKHVDQLRPRPELLEERSSPRLSRTFVVEQAPVVKSGGSTGDEKSTTWLEHLHLGNSRVRLPCSDRQVKHSAYFEGL